MKIQIKYFSIGIMLFASLHAWSNNIQITNTRLVSQNTIEESVMVEFDIEWQNSWRLAGGPGNWDAAWVFVKYRVGAGPWTHAFLHNTDHETCAELTTSSGLLTPGSPFDPFTNPAMGVFLYRPEPGVGNVECQQVRLRWNYGENLLNDNTQVDVKVFAIEHVYIPAGAFQVGSGGTESGAFYTYPTSTNPYQINNESAITVGTTSGNLHYLNPSGNSGDQTGTIPVAFPKGTNAFYAMKYEVSQQGYTDFLNTLSRAQQLARVRSDISGTSVTNRFVMSGQSTPIFRNGISCRSTIPASPAPVEFASDLSNNSIENEFNDGQTIACNFLFWIDLAAYLDWAALRPMTELEYEKCARGTVTPVANEYVWGNHTINLLTAVINAGEVSETPSVSYVNCSGTGFVNPTRCGIFARENNDRTLSGAGYYGCMDLGGNVWERGITVGNPQGRSFNGLHGNGMLGAEGFADVANWPDFFSTGACMRGGSFTPSFNDNRASGRTYAAFAFLGNESTGGRGVRTAP